MEIYSADMAHVVNYLFAALLEIHEECQTNWHGNTFTNSLLSTVLPLHAAAANCKDTVLDIRGTKIESVFLVFFMVFSGDTFKRKLKEILTNIFERKKVLSSNSVLFVWVAYVTCFCIQILF